MCRLQRVEKLTYESCAFNFGSENRKGIIQNDKYIERLCSHGLGTKNIYSFLTDILFSHQEIFFVSCCFFFFHCIHALYQVSQHRSQNPMAKPRFRALSTIFFISVHYTMNVICLNMERIMSRRAYRSFPRAPSSVHTKNRLHPLILLWRGFLSNLVSRYLRTPRDFLDIAFSWRKSIWPGRWVDAHLPLD